MATHNHPQVRVVCVRACASFTHFQQVCLPSTWLGTLPGTRKVLFKEKKKEIKSRGPGCISAWEQETAELSTQPQTT